ncbi:hypothetical protein [Vallitalea okinawensis]|uniref:hypothetical protein n=1 Tax=Vallitalea okinawensis TaxID=2078660 RepID=UPI000CFD1C35|nr:hypothetical protein [Vallitalea okinawensis]
MKGRRILLDKTELVLIVAGKKEVKTLNLTYEDIQAIIFEPCREFRYFNVVSSERIVINTSQSSHPILYPKLKNKKYFEEYKQGLTRFAISNRITFHNNLDI